MSKPFTHIVVLRVEPSQNGVGDRDIASLYRVVDGMVIAEVNNKCVLFGVDPRQPFGQRMFLDHSAAMAFLRRIADVDANGKFTCGNQDFGRPLDWEHVALESLVYQASIETRDEGALPGQGPRKIELPNRQAVAALTKAN